MRLLSNSDKQAALHRTAPLWPHLRTLTFHVASPWSQDRDDVESDEEDELPPDIVLLLDVIQLRKAVGAELELLRLEGPHARAFHDDLALALMKSQLQVNMEVLPGLSPGNDSQLLSSGDWAYSGLFYGSEYRAHLYRKMQSGPHGQHHFHWGSVPRGPGSPLSP